MKRTLSMMLAIMIMLTTFSCLSVVSVAAEAPTYEAEVEDNGTSTTAQEIKIDEYYLGSSKAKNDVDWYVFENTEDYFELSFKFDSNSNISGVRDGWNIYLYHPGDLNSAFASVNVTTGSWTSAKFPYTGKIYVKIQPHNFNNGSYAPLSNSNYIITVGTTEDVLWETESNNKGANANAIEIGKTYISATQSSNDVDWFVFNNVEDYFQLKMNFVSDSYADGVMDGWLVKLYRPENLNDSFASATVTTGSWTSAKFPYTGEIYIKVEPDNFNNGSYAPSAYSYYNICATTTTDPKWENENNGEKDTATLLNIGETYIGASQSKNDVDWYKINNTKDYFSLTFNFDSGSYLDGVNDGWLVKLYRPGNLTDSFASATVTTSSWTSAKFPYTGEIYIKVEPDNFNNGSYAPSAYSYYNICVTTTTDSNWEDENNGTEATADILNIGETYIGASQVKNDVDWYKFNNTKDYFNLTFNFDSDSYLSGVNDGWLVKLYRPGNLTTAFASKTVTTGSWTSAKFPYSGEIYVKVEPENFNNGSYAPSAYSYYNIKVTTTQDILWENETNDTSDKVDVIKNGTKCIGASQSCSDVDWFVLESKNGYIDLDFNIDYDACSAEQVSDGWDVYVYTNNDFTKPVYKITDITKKVSLKKKAIGEHAYIKVQPANFNNTFYAPKQNCYYDLTVTHTPATPKVTTSNELTGVQIKWNAVDGATKYVVFRRQAGTNSWKAMGTTTATTFLDKTVQSGVYYCYSVRAYNSIGKYSDFIQANTSNRKYMATPKLTTIYNHTNGLAIKWNAVAGVTNGYRVYRRGAGSTYWTYLGTTTNLYYIDSGVKNANGGYYRYTVIADGGYHSKFDETGLYLKRLANPSLLSATSSTAGITVKWSAINGTTGYYVYRKTASSNWVKIASVGGTSSTSYIDKTAQKGVTYTYTVRAVYGATTSAYNTGISCYDKY